MSRVVIFNKPFRVLSQFRETPDKPTLSEYFDDKALRVAGRLDYDSEGVLILSDDGALVQKISHPRFKLAKTYWAQVEGIPDEHALQQLQRGVNLKDGKTLPASVRLIPEPESIWLREPPIRVRQAIPTQWLELTIKEGRNRQVRRMTAAVNFPTLRLVRAQVGDWGLGSLAPGQWREIEQS